MIDRTLNRPLRAVLALALACAATPSAASAASGKGSDRPQAPPAINSAFLSEVQDPPGFDAEYVPGEVIVRFKPVISAAAAAASHRRAASRSSRAVGPVKGVELVRLNSGMSVEAAVKAYEAMPEVAYAEPNYVVSAAVQPDDTSFGDLWGLHNTGQAGGTPDADIDAPEAWSVTTGDASALVAVIDSGLDYEHPDLSSNVWVNPGEVPGNGIDDDGNGYVDDVYGLDVVNGDGDPMDDNGHGTHVSGTIAADGNNGIGVVGVNWDVTILPIKILNSVGSGSVSSALEAYSYAAAAGARVINNSWGGYYAFSQAEYDALAALDLLVVCAAGNDAADIDGTSKYYPAAYDLPNVLAVAASNNDDAAATWSTSGTNYGAAGVDVFAPGTGIKSTYPGSRRLAIAGGATETPLASDDFASLGSWSQFSYMGFPYAPWTRNAASYSSAPSSASCLGYVDNQRSQLRRATPVNLSAAGYPGLRMKLRCDTERGYDFVRWGVYDQSANTSTLLGRTSGDTGGQYVDVLVNLTAFAGQPDIYPWVELRANATSSSSAGYEGAWVDDFKVFDLTHSGPGTPWMTVADFGTAYATMSGTSMAAPHVSGIAALLLARDSTLTWQELKDAIMYGAEPKAPLSGLCVTGARVNAWRSLAIVNGVPHAADDAYDVVTGRTLHVAAPGILANDADIDGDPLSAVLVSPPTNGDLVLLPDGSFTYTPKTSFEGLDTFTYRATDPSAESNLATVVLDVRRLVSVYRFYNVLNGSHFYTPSIDEANHVMVTWPHVYLFEGVAYSLDPRRNYQPLYRFYNVTNGSHFYTASASERDTVLAAWPGVFFFEGETYAVTPVSEAGKLPVYRFYNLRNGSHFYTGSADEANHVMATWPHVYQFEGAAFWLGQ